MQCLHPSVNNRTINQTKASHHQTRRWRWWWWCYYKLYRERFIICIFILHSRHLHVAIHYTVVKAIYWNLLNLTHTKPLSCHWSSCRPDHSTRQLTNININLTHSTNNIKILHLMKRVLKIINFLNIVNKYVINEE